MKDFLYRLFFSFLLFLVIGFFGFPALLNYGNCKVLDSLKSEIDDDIYFSCGCYDRDLIESQMRFNEKLNVYIEYDNDWWLGMFMHSDDYVFYDVPSVDDYVFYDVPSVDDYCSCLDDCE